MLLITLSHLINLVVVTIIPILIFRNAPAMTTVYGPDSPARRILACLYGTIALASGAALVTQFALGRPEFSVQIALILFPLQIAYKFATIPAVGLRNPVVISNLFIAIFQATSLGVWLSA
jgi:hypothetical protein